VVVGGAGGGLDARAGGDAGEHDPGDAEVAQQGVEAGVVEGAAAPLGDPVVARLRLELVEPSATPGSTNSYAPSAPKTAQ
jgi:hypothetical protein